MSTRPIPSAIRIATIASQLRQQEAKYRTQAKAIHQSLMPAGQPDVWDAKAATDVVKVRGVIDSRLDGFADAAGQVAGALEQLATRLRVLEPARKALASKVDGATRANTFPLDPTLLSDKQALSIVDSQVRQAFQEAAGKINGAAHRAKSWDTNVNRNPLAYWSMVSEEFFNAEIKVGKGLVRSVYEPIVGIAQLVTHPEQLAQMAAAFEQDPVATTKRIGESILDLETLKRDPAEWAGYIGGSVLLTLLTCGAGGAVKGAGGTSKAAQAAKSAEAVEKAGGTIAKMEVDAARLAKGGDLAGVAETATRLPPNAAIRTAQGFNYTTDQVGRVTNITAKLDSLVQGSSYTQKTADLVHSLGFAKDDAGHLIGQRFGGPGESYNLVPQHLNLNRGAWNVMETKWQSAIEGGRTVQVEMYIEYGADARPMNFSVYWTDGDIERTVDFMNAAQNSRQVVP